MDLWIFLCSLGARLLLHVHAFAGRLWPKLEIPSTDLTGKTVIVTGSNSGIGLEAARSLASMNATVVLACRDLEKAHAARASFASNFDKVECMQLDCSSLQSVEAFVKAWNGRPLDVLINNAGAASAYFQLTEEGYTKSYATNVYSHVLLTLRLLPCFQPNARIIETSSNTHYSIDGKHVSPEDMDFAQHLQRKSGFKLGDKFTPTETLYDYARSKLLQIMFVKALQKHLDQNPMYRERHIKADAFHPGWVVTNIWHREEAWSGKGLLKQTLITAFVERTGLEPAQGAATGVWLAADADPEREGGGFYFRNRPITPNVLALDEKRVQGFWKGWVKAAGMEA